MLPASSPSGSLRVSVAFAFAGAGCSAFVGGLVLTALCGPVFAATLTLCMGPSRGRWRMRGDALVVAGCNATVCKLAAAAFAEARLSRRQLLEAHGRLRLRCRTLRLCLLPERPVLRRDQDRCDVLFRIGGAVVMLSRAKEATDALLVEHRRPAPPPHGDAAMDALRHTRRRRDILIRLGGAVVVQARAQETMDSLREEHRRMGTQRSARARSPRRLPPRPRPRSPPRSAGAVSSAVVIDELNYDGPAPPRPRPPCQVRHARASRTRSPRRSPPRVQPPSSPGSAAGPSGAPGAASSALVVDKLASARPALPQPRSLRRRARRAHRDRRGGPIAATVTARPEQRGL